MGFPTPQFLLRNPIRIFFFFFDVFFALTTEGNDAELL